LRAVCFVARLANMHWLFVAPRFAHPIPQSQCATLRDLFRGSLNFWSMEGAARDTAMNNCQSNLAVSGGLLIAAAYSI
jgi:hypothetical protein